MYVCLSTHLISSLSPANYQFLALSAHLQRLVCACSARTYTSRKHIYIHVIEYRIVKHKNGNYTLPYSSFFLFECLPLV